MALEVARGIFQKDAISGAHTQDVTGLSFQPKAVILWSNSRTSALADGFATNVAHWNWSLGFSNASSNWCIGSFSRDDPRSPPKSVVRRRHAHAAITILSNLALTAISEATVSTFLSNGFRLSWAFANTEQLWIEFLALGGSDLTDTAISTFVTGSGTQTVSVPGGFRPDLLFFLSSGMPTAPPGEDTSHNLMLGLASSPSQQGSVCVAAVNNLSVSDTYRTERSDRCLSLFDLVTSEGNIDVSAELVAINEGSFDLSYSISGLADYVGFLALKGGSYQVGTETARTSVEGSSKVTPVTFSPKGLLLSSWNSAPSTAIQPNTRFSIGAAAGGTQETMWGEDPDGLNAPNTRLFYRATRAIILHDNNTTTVQSEATAALGTNQFTLDWAVRDSTAREFLWTAFGDVGAAPEVGQASLLGRGLLTAKGSLVHTDAAALLGSAKASGSGQVVVRASAKLQVSAAVVAGGSLVREATVSLSGSAVLDARAERTLEAKLALQGRGNIVGQGQLVRWGRASLLGQATLTGAAQAMWAGTAELVGSASLFGVGEVGGNPVGRAELLGQAAIVGTSSVILVGSASLSGSAIISAKGTPTGGARAALSASAFVAAQAQVTRSAAGVFAGSGALRISAALIQGGRSQLVTAAELSVRADVTRFASTSVHGAGTLAVEAAVVGEAVSSLLGAGTLIASGLSIRGGAGTLVGSGTLTASGTVSTPLVGVAVLVGTAGVRAAGQMTRSAKASVVGQAFLSSGAVALVMETHNGVTRLIDPSAYASTAQFFLEVHIYTTSADFPVHAWLYDVDAGEPVAESQILSTALSLTRERSSVFSLPPGPRPYQIQFGGDKPGANYFCQASDILVKLS